jgi:hypothetical protein
MDAPKVLARRLRTTWRDALDDEAGDVPGWAEM